MTALFKRKCAKGVAALALVALILVSAMSTAFTALGAEEKSLGYFKYTVDEDGVCITEYTGEGGDVSIPNIIDDKSVVAIGDEAFWYCDKLTAVRLPNYLEYIGARAFQGCKLIKSVSIPETVYEIGDACFEGCTSLREINVPSELVYVGAFAFDGTPWLTRFEDNSSIIFGGRVFYKYLGNASVVNIPEGITGISANAFEGNKNLEYVNIPQSTLFVGGMAFYNCPNLKSISLPDGLYYIGPNAFGAYGVSGSGENKLYEDVTIYANSDTLGAEYAENMGIELKAPGLNATPDDLPNVESCSVKDISSDAGVKKRGFFESQGSVVAFVLIVVSCIVIIGGLSLYFTLREKKLKKERKEKQKAKNKKKK